MTTDGAVEYGAHLPLVDLGTGRSMPALKAYAGAAAALGFRYLCANDHLRFGRPWLDGPTALAALIDASGDLRLATTASLPVLRGPVPLAKTLAAIDVLSGGRLVVGVAPGSSAADYAAAGIGFQQRWRRFDEAVRLLRALLHGDADFSATRGVVLEPRPLQRPGPPIWVASWGSPAGLRRVARLGDGWLASAYNTTPERFAAGRAALPDDFPTALATMWTWVAKDRAEGDRVLSEVLAPILGRQPGDLRAQVCVGTPEHCGEVLHRYAQAGCDRVYLWPLGDERRQLELVASDVSPLIGL